VLLAAIARCRLELGDAGAALAAAEEALEIADRRGLATCALSAPLALAPVLRATQGAAAGRRIDAVLSRAMDVARDAGATVFASRISAVAA
jgi:hypothetical protein